MNINEAADRLSEIVYEAQAKFEGLGVITSVEIAYLNRMMKPIEDESRAKFITLSLVITTDKITEGEEYCLSIGARMTKRGMDEDGISRDAEIFNRMVNEAVERIAATEDKTEAVTTLANEASLEFEELVQKIQRSEKKGRLTQLIGIFVVLGIFAALIIIAINV